MKTAKNALDLPSEIASTTRLPRYRKLWRNSVIVTSLVALIPLIVMAVVNYHQDQEAYRAESHSQISRILSDTKRSLVLVIEEKCSAISMVIGEQAYDQLRNDARLKTTLRNLNSAFGGFVDLGVIDPDGIQSYYAGPYDFKGKNYYNQAWFHEVLIRGAYVSDVFMGYRGLPHFVIAFKHETDDGKTYVLRATVDTELLNWLIHAQDLDRNTDAFIINHDGALQTPSAFFGNILDTINIDVPSQSRGWNLVEEYRESGQWVTCGYAYIARTSFILMAIKREPGLFSKWVYHRSDLLWFLAISIAVIVAVVLYGATNLVRRLRDADLRRAKAFHNIEYTNKMATIGRMAAGVAHEINNPLAIINENAGLLKDMVEASAEYPKRDRVLRLAGSILGSVDRCKKVTHRLLGFARRMDVSQELIDLDHLLKEVVGFQRSEAAHRNIKVNYNIPPDLPSIESDRGQLQQVFLNVISNAFAAVDDGGRIDILADQIDSGEITISIRDNGSGITEENLKHIFEPFYSTKGEFGTGLGLSITHDIVERLGGRIEVESSLGEGTSFVVTLPLNKESLLGVGNA